MLKLGFAGAIVGVILDLFLNFLLSEEIRSATSQGLMVAAGAGFSFLTILMLTHTLLRHRKDKAGVEPKGVGTD